MEELKMKLNDAYEAQEDYKKISKCLQLEASTDATSLGNGRKGSWQDKDWKSKTAHQLGRNK